MAECASPDYCPWADASTTDSTSGWFSAKLKVLLPLLVCGAQVNIAPYDSEPSTSAAAATAAAATAAAAAAATSGDSVAWRGSAMVFVERKVNCAEFKELVKRKSV